MTTPEPAPPRVKLEVTRIETLFQEIEAGELRIPRFHRPFVWRPENMIALFDSIQRGYPIGSLLIWETDEEVRSFDHIGPVPISSPRSSLVAYILDGQQRLSTLYGVLRLGADFPKGPRQQDWQWWIYYDLKEHRFLHSPRGAVATELLPLRTILRTADFLKEAQRLSSAFGGREAEPLLDEGQSLAQRFKAHQLAVTRIQGGSLAQAVDIFSRLNPTGQKMTADQVASALTYREGPGAFDLAACIDQILEGLGSYNLGKVSRNLVFRAIVAAAGLDVQGTAWGELVTKLADELPSIVDETRRALYRSAEFLADKLGVPGDQLLPYAPQLLLLSEFFRLCPDPSATQQDALRRLFWGTSFSGWFAGADPTQIRTAIEEVRALASGSRTELRAVRLDDPCRPFPEVFDLRSARLRVLLLVMLQRLRPLDPQGNAMDAQSLLSSHGGRAYSQVFTRATHPLVTRTANRVLLPIVRGQPARKQLLELAPEVRDAVLQSHGINEEAYVALVADDAPAFIAARAHHLAQIERAFMAELGLTPATEELGDSDIDTDDD